MSAADRGRGGFDSHTFPPRGRSAGAGIALLAALTLALAPAGPARAQTGDPPPLGPDSSRVLQRDAPVTQRPAKSLEPRNARGERVRPWHQAPWAIMARSGIVPGWGQWTNRRHVKALLVAGVEVGAAVQLADAIRETNDALDRQQAAIRLGDDPAAALAAAEYDRAFNRRSTWAWLVGTGIALSMLDAYVDAHLLQFDADFGPEPKLFDEDDAPTGRVGGGEPDLRLGLRLHFQGPQGR